MLDFSNAASIKISKALLYRILNAFIFLLIRQVSVLQHSWAEGFGSEEKTSCVLVCTSSTFTKVPTWNTSMNFNNMQTFKTQEQFYGRSVIIADRDLIEQGADEILQDASSKDVALLVVGDPFGATTHTDLVLRARQANINCKIIHNASIMNAVGCCGLQVS